MIDEGFFRRYRELLDAEDAAFDELEHAYEDGDRAHWDEDLDAWRHDRREALCLPREAGPRARRYRLTQRHPVSSRSTNDRGRVDDAVGATHEEVARAAMTSTSVATQSAVSSITHAGSRTSSC